MRLQDVALQVEEIDSEEFAPFLLSQGWDEGRCDKELFAIGGPADILRHIVVVTYSDELGRRLRHGGSVFLRFETLSEPDGSPLNRIQYARLNAAFILWGTCPLLKEPRFD